MKTNDHKTGSPADSQGNSDKIVLTFFAPNDDDGPRTLYLVTSKEDGGLLAAIDDRGDNGEATALERTGFAGCVSGLYFYPTGEWYEQYLSELDPEIPVHKLTKS